MEFIGEINKLYLSDIIVKENFRKYYVFTKMFQLIKIFCQINKVKEIYIHVNKNNNLAKNIYEKLGFIQLDLNNIYFQDFTIKKLKIINLNKEICFMMKNI